LNIRIEITDTNKPYAVIYTNKITPEVQQAVSLLDTKSELITANDDEKIIIIQPTEIYMIRIENSETIIYCENHKYRSKKRLYELLSLLGKDFIQISKSAVINLKQIDFVEPSFSGMMKLFLKNKQSEYISRKYLSEFKKCLGL
jgi:two-component system response regulator LytT